MMTPDRLVLLLGVRPDQYRDFAALRGDPSDNLPGVRGIGPRTAARLLGEFGTAAAAFDDLDSVRARLGAGVADKMSRPESRAAWELNCEVMTMRSDLAIGLDLGAGPGVLPLEAAAVSAVFHRHRLTWSAGKAMRVLAEVDPGQVEPAYAENTTAVPAWRTAGPRRMPALSTRVGSRSSWLCSDPTLKKRGRPMNRTASIVR